MSYGTLQIEKMTTESGYSLGAGNASSFKNRLINGGMVFDQRNAGAAVTAGSAYTLDRWNVDRVWGGSTVTIQQSSTAPTGFVKSLSATVTTGAASASSSYFSIQQYIEGNNIADMALGTASAKQFTVSFWVRSSVTGTFGVCFRNSAFDLSYCTTYTIDAANTWEQKFVTIAAPTSGTFGTGNSYGLNVIFSLGGGSSVKPSSNNAWVSGNFLAPIGQTDLISTTGATFFITGTQLEVGTVATSFDFRSYGTELMLCQRYLPAINYTGNGYVDMGYIQSSNSGNTLYHFQVPTRVAPTGISVTNIGGIGMTTVTNGGTWSSVVFNGATNTSAQWTTTFTASSWGTQINFPFFYVMQSSTSQILFTGCEL